MYVSCTENWEKRLTACKQPDGLPLTTRGTAGGESYSNSREEEGVEGLPRGQLNAGGAEVVADHELCGKDIHTWPDGTDAKTCYTAVVDFARFRVVAALSLLYQVTQSMSSNSADWANCAVTATRCSISTFGSVLIVCRMENTSSSNDDCYFAKVAQQQTDRLVGETTRCFVVLCIPGALRCPWLSLLYMQKLVTARRGDPRCMLYTHVSYSGSK